MLRRSRAELPADFAAGFRGAAMLLWTPIDDYSPSFIFSVYNIATPKCRAPLSTPYMHGYVRGGKRNRRVTADIADYQRLTRIDDGTARRAQRQVSARVLVCVHVCEREEGAGRERERLRRQQRSWSVLCGTYSILSL